MSTVTVLVLLFGYHTSTSSRTASAESSVVTPVQSGTGTSTGTSAGGTTAPSSGSASSGTTGSTGSGTTGSGTSGSGTSGSGTSGAGTSGSSVTVTGDSASTRWGPVQVQITVAGGRVTDVSVIDYPENNGRDKQINARALPILVRETLAAQSAHIDMVSGATVTSNGYIESLQSALDQAGL